MGYVPRRAPLMPKIPLRSGTITCKACGAPVQPNERCCSYCRTTPGETTRPFPPSRTVK